MTTDEQLAMKWEIDAIDWKISLWKAEAQREAERSFERAGGPERARAAAAAEAWTGVKPTTAALRLQAHVVRLSREDPPIAIHWLQKFTRSMELVRPVGGVSFTGRRAVWIRPIVTFEDYVGGLHEFGHERTYRLQDTLDREHDAWVWARRVALEWPPAAQKVMVDSLQTYLRNAKLSDLPAVERIERLCSSLAYRIERQRRLEIELGRRR